MVLTDSDIVTVTFEQKDNIQSVWLLVALVFFVKKDRVIPITLPHSQQIL